jgi:hypothetical protein
MGLPGIVRFLVAGLSLLVIVMAVGCRSNQPEKVVAPQEADAGRKLEAGSYVDIPCSTFGVKMVSFDFYTEIGDKERAVAPEGTTYAMAKLEWKRSDESTPDVAGDKDFRVVLETTRTGTQPQRDAVAELAYVKLFKEGFRIWEGNRFRDVRVFVLPPDLAQEGLLVRVWEPSCEESVAFRPGRFQVEQSN